MNKNMSKKIKSNEVKNTPDTYVGLTIDTKNQDSCLIEDIHGGYYIFDKPEACHIISKAIHKKWATIRAFMEETEQTILCYHENLFNVAPPKNQDTLLTAQYVWNKLFSLAVDRRTSQVPVSATGRKSTIGLSEYRYGEAILANKKPDFTGMLKTPQSKVCLKLFREAMDSTRPEHDEAPTSEHMVTEAILRKYVEDHAAELHTKQDPWRIFQYYRKDLIEEKLIRRQ